MTCSGLSLCGAWCALLSPCYAPLSHMSPFPPPAHGLAGRWACLNIRRCDPAILASWCLCHPLEAGGDSVLGYHDEICCLE